MIQPIRTITAVFMLTIICYNGYAGTPMKCVDGSGRVVYTESSSCVEAFRSLPPAPKTAAQRSAEFQEGIRREREMAKIRATNERYNRRIQDEYQYRQRIAEEEERKEKDCARKRIELERMQADAADAHYDNWWRNRATAAAKEYRLDCGG